MLKSPAGLVIEGEECTMVLHALSTGSMRPQIAITCVTHSQVYEDIHAMRHLDEAGVVSVGNWVQLIPSGATYDLENKL